jgi:hypothetical protein
MRKFISVFSFITVICCFIACQKEITGDLTTTTPTGNLRAKIDGTVWIADKVASASIFGGQIAITGLSNDKKTLAIVLTDSGLHHYTLDDNSINAAAYIDSNLATVAAFTTNQGTTAGQAGGQVTVTKIDTTHKTISGTFSFKVFRQLDGQQRDFSEGSFTDIPYTTGLPPSASTDTFHVKIDGALYTPPSVLGASTTGIIAVNGTDATGSKTVGLVFPSNITPGTYTLDFFGLTYIGQYNPDTDPTHSKASTSGTLTILEHNTATKRIRGTFQFHAEELLNPAHFSELTEGYFSVTYF